MREGCLESHFDAAAWAELVPYQRQRLLVDSRRGTPLSLGFVLDLPLLDALLAPWATLPVLDEAFGMDKDHWDTFESLALSWSGSLREVLVAASSLLGESMASSFGGERPLIPKRASLEQPDDPLRNFYYSALCWHKATPVPDDRGVWFVIYDYACRLGDVDLLANLVAKPGSLPRELCEMYESTRVLSLRVAYLLSSNVTPDMVPGLYPGERRTRVLLAKGHASRPRP